MNVYRLMAIAVTTSAAGLCATACSAGITTVSGATSASPATSSAASSPGASSPDVSASHSASAPASPSPVDTLSVDAPIGSFPIPPGAQVVSNITCDKQVIIELSKVTPATASSFYVSELPRAGYQISSNIGGTAPGVPGPITEIAFTGHGYQGLIIAEASLGALPSTGPSISLPSSLTKNFAEISLTPPGATGTGC